MSTTPLDIQVNVTGAEQAMSTLDSLQGTIRTLNRLVVQVSITTFVWTIVSRGLRHAEERMIRTQEDLNDKIQKFGKNSQEAQRAARALKLAQEDLAAAQFQQIVQYVTLSAGMVTMVYNAARLIGQINALTGAYWGLAAAKAAALGPLGLIGLGVGVGAAVTIGGIYVTGGFGGGGSSMDFDRQWNEAGRYAKRELERQRGGTW